MSNNGASPAGATNQADKGKADLPAPTQLVDVVERLEQRTQVLPPSHVTSEQPAKARNAEKATPRLSKKAAEPTTSGTKISSLFSSVDADNDGYLEQNELSDFIRSVGGDAFDTRYSGFQIRCANLLSLRHQ